MNFKSLAAAALTVSAALLATTASADTLKFGKTEDAIKYRQNSLFLISQHFGSLGAMANGRAEFNADVAKQNAAVLETLAALPWQGSRLSLPSAFPFRILLLLWPSFYPP